MKIINIDLTKDCKRTTSKKPALHGMQEHHKHTEMAIYAAACDLARPEITVWVDYSDGSHDVLDTFSPAYKEILYIVEGEEYTIDVPTAKYDANWLIDEPTTLTELKSQVCNWLSGEDYTVTRILFIKAYKDQDLNVIDIIKDFDNKKNKAK